MLKKGIAFIALNTLGATLAWSAVTVEPLVSYGIGSGGISGPIADYNGAMYGGKLGYRISGAGAGIRYNGGAFDVEAENGMAGSTLNSYGVYISYNLPFLLKASIAYYIGANQSITFPNDSSMDLSGSGNSITIGFGFAFLANIFVERQSYTFENDDTFTLYSLGVSVPLSFL